MHAATLRVAACIFSFSRKLLVPPLRFAAVGMKIYMQRDRYWKASLDSNAIGVEILLLKYCHGWDGAQGRA
jgi:hypothetical protein